jgi:hypothetical protein
MDDVEIPSFYPTFIHSPSHTKTFSKHTEANQLGGFRYLSFKPFCYRQHMNITGREMGHVPTM